MSVDISWLFGVAPSKEAEHIKRWLVDNWPGMSRHKYESALQKCGLDRAFLAKENSITVMGGYFQKHLQHYTLSHDDIMSHCQELSQGILRQNRFIAETELAEYSRRGDKWCTTTTPRTVSAVRR